ncbi:MAG TPA: type II secretion system protein [Terrimicrobiaceae bacterium]
MVSEPAGRLRLAEVSGFTLFEVLVALGLFAFAVVGLLAGIRAMADVADEARIASAVRQQMESRVAFMEVLRPANYEKTITVDFPKMTITEQMLPETVSRGEGKQPLAGLWRVRIRARWEVSGRHGEDEASFLRHDP